MCRGVRRAMLSKAAETITICALWKVFAVCDQFVSRLSKTLSALYFLCGLNGAAYICTFPQACPSGQAFRIDKQKLHSIVVVLTLVFAGVTLKII